MVPSLYSSHHILIGQSPGPGRSSVVYPGIILNFIVWSLDVLVLNVTLF